MKILYDYQAFTFQKFGGISRYFNEILKYIHTTKENNAEAAIKCSDNAYLRHAEFFPEKIIKSGFDFRGKHRLYRLINLKYAKSVLKRGDFDVFHPTYFDPYFLEYVSNKPFVITVHDMIHEIYPEYFLLSDSVSEWKHLLIHKASKIIAVSENTKRDIVRLCGVPEENIVVTHHGSSLKPVTGEMPINLPKEYVLYVGGRAGYKNFYFFMHAVRPLLLENKDLHIVCTGEGFSKKEKIWLEKLGVGNKVHQFFANEQVLAYLYSKARAFVFPSLYEGFGIPILEAFTCGCPAILSNTSSLPEVGGEAAQYFDPKDMLSMYESIREVIYNDDLRQDMAKKGYEQLENFSWDKTAQKTVQLYSSLV